MELTAEQFATFDKRLEALEQAFEQRLEARIIDSQARIIQWVIGLFIGSMVLMTTLGGVYIPVLLAR